MSTLKYIERLQRMDQLIRLKATGTSEDFAKKMGISRSVLMEAIRDLRDLGGQIEFCPVRRSYFYKRADRLHIGFLSEDQRSVKGGKNGKVLRSPEMLDGHDEYLCYTVTKSHVLL